MPEGRPAYRRAVKFDKSPPLRLITPPPANPKAAERLEIPLRGLDILKERAGPSAIDKDPLVGRGGLGPVAPMPAPLLTFDGTSDVDNQIQVGFRVETPDTNGDVGPNHYVQWNNLVFEVFDKNGNPVLGPLPGNILFTGFGGPCEANNDGDPIVLYDQLADRWVLSQVSHNEGTQCIAVSETADPTGAYFRYAFVVAPGAENEYTKLGVWPDGYYATFRKFPNFEMVAASFEREKMLLGLPAQEVLFTIPAPAGPGCTGAGDCYEGVLPSHLEGATPPPTGSPNYFLMSFDDEVFSTTPVPGQDSYKLWKFQVDWATPGSSTFTEPTTIPATEMDINLCGFGPCVPQQNSFELLDTLSPFTMNRLVYRNFGDHESLWVNNTVNLGSNRAGIRWAEIRDPNGTPPLLYQEGTHGPDDGLHRWMGSLAVDKDGNMALGYSVSGTSLFPSIRYAGRLAGDPPGTLPQTETEMFAGTGSQISTFGRWGDYSAMSVDETDDCTFWYTQEYYQTTAGFDFKTRIGAFKFPSCTPASADLSITKGDDPDPVLAGQTLTYALIVSNNGPSAASGVNVTDTLPEGVTFLSATPSQGTCAGGATVGCDLGSLPSGGNATVSIVVTAMAAGTISNTASVSGSQADPDGSNNSDTETTTVNPAADLSVAKSDSPDPVKAGRLLTYTITVANHGPSPASSVTMTDALPSSVLFVSVTPSQGACTGTTTVACRLGIIAAGGSATVTIVVRPRRAGVITNVATVAGSEADPDGTNNSDSEATSVVKHLS